MTTEQASEAPAHAPPAEPAWVQALREARAKIVAGAHGARGTASFSDAAEALQSVDRAIRKFVDGE